jgi:Ran GTPase-activating protein (RanGAP) involved in mRNA processing and transport
MPPKQTISTISVKGKGKEEALRVIRGLKNTPTTTDLDIGYNNLEEEDALILATALEKNNTLTSLKLRNNQIAKTSQTGAQALIKALKTNQTLKILGLDLNDLNNQTAQSILEILEGNDTLTQINLADNKAISEENLAKIKALTTVNQDPTLPQKRATLLQEIESSIQTLPESITILIAAFLSKEQFIETEERQDWTQRTKKTTQTEPQIT